MIIALLLGGVFGWVVGTNDMGYILGPVVGSGLMPWKRIGMLSSLFLLVGAVLGGVKGLENVIALDFSNDAHYMAFYLSSIFVMVTLNSLGLPTPASQTVVGSIIGLAAASSGFRPENVFRFSMVFLSWYTTPFATMLLGYFLYKLLSHYMKRLRSVQHQETLLSVLASIGVAYGSYSFGANNVANVTGILVGNCLDTKGAAVLGGISIALGVLCCGKRSAIRVGKGILELDHLASLVSIFSQAITVWFFSIVGVPVSSSQAVIGGILGVGHARGMKLESRKVLFKVLGSWFLVPIVSGLLSFISMKILIRFW